MRCDQLHIPQPPVEEPGDDIEALIRKSLLEPSAVLTHRRAGRVSDDLLRQYKWWIPILLIAPLEVRIQNAEIDAVCELAAADRQLVQYGMLLCRDCDFAYKAIGGLSMRPDLEETMLPFLYNDTHKLAYCRCL